VLIDDAKPRRGRPIRSDGPDLRTRFIDAAYAKVIESGAQSLSMRGLAEGLGVSASAYLHYFDGPQEILDEVAYLGFDELKTALGNSSGSRDRDALVSTGMAYIAFGVANGRLYRTMFSRAFARGLAEVEHGSASVDPMSKGDSPTGSTMTARESGRADRRNKFFKRLNRVKTGSWLILRDRFTSLGLPPVCSNNASLAFAALLHGLVGEFIDEGLFFPENGNIYDFSLKRRQFSHGSINLFLDGALSTQPSKPSLPD
jgi:AcrR family transcriptional regulator